MGIRKKIRRGFLGLAFLLFFSGVISVFELRHLSSQTQELFDSSVKNMELSRRMLDALQQQTLLILRKDLGRERGNFDSLYTISHTDFEAALTEATITVRDREDLDAVYTARSKYEEILTDFLDAPPGNGVGLLMDTYRESYQALTSAIKDYMLALQNKMQVRAENISETAYRAITPGILTLGVGILLLVIFLYLLDIYFAKPVTAINRGLKNYLSARIPFQVKMEGRDEVFEIKEQIESLISAGKKKNE